MGVNAKVIHRDDRVAGGGKARPLPLVVGTRD